MTEKEIKLELAKAALMGGLGMDSARKAYEWLTEDENANVNKVKVEDVADDMGEYKVRFVNGCKANDIKTVGDLVRYGRHAFLRQNQVGYGLIAYIDNMLQKQFKITNW